MRDVTPLRDTGRAVLEPPKPAPVPRPRPSEDDAPTANAPGEPAATRGSLSDAELFRTWMNDVQPLADHDRAELRTPRPAPLPASYNQADEPGFGAMDTTASAPPLPRGSEALDEQALFQLLMRDTRPLATPARAALATAAPSPVPRKRHEDDEAVLREALAPLTLEDRLATGDETIFSRPGLPRRVIADLRRGRWVLQGEIDLHGYTRDEAREALAHFLARALRQGSRCVRVIHGKGLGSPGRFSILKHLSRGWLAQREEILAFCQAGPNQGGSGALMVLLRSPRRD